MQGSTPGGRHSVVAGCLVPVLKGFWVVWCAGRWHTAFVGARSVCGLLFLWAGCSTPFYLLEAPVGHRRTSLLPCSRHPWSTGAPLCCIVRGIREPQARDGPAIKARWQMAQQSRSEIGASSEPRKRIVLAQHFFAACAKSDLLRSLSQEALRSPLGMVIRAQWVYSAGQEYPRAEWRCGKGPTNDSEITPETCERCT